MPEIRTEYRWSDVQKRRCRKSSKVSLYMDAIATTLCIAPLLHSVGCIPAFCLFVPCDVGGCLSLVFCRIRCFNLAGVKNLWRKCPIRDLSADYSLFGDQLWLQYFAWRFWFVYFWQYKDLLGRWWWRQWTWTSQEIIHPPSSSLLYLVSLSLHSVYLMFSIPDKLWSPSDFPRRRLPHPNLPSPPKTHWRISRKLTRSPCTQRWANSNKQRWVENSISQSRRLILVSTLLVDRLMPQQCWTLIARNSRWQRISMNLKVGHMLWRRLLQDWRRSWRMWAMRRIITRRMRIPMMLPCKTLLMEGGWLS